MAWTRGTDTTDPGGQAVVAVALLVCRTTCSEIFLLNASGRVGVAVEANLAVVTAST